MRHITRFLVAGFAATLVACGSTASAGLITVNNVIGKWVNVQGGGSLTGVGTNEIRWGTNLGNGQSGYAFDAVVPQPFDTDVNLQFEVGTFTHINRAIASGTSITSADLELSLDVTVNVPPTSPESLSGLAFLFKHNETPNVGSNDNQRDIVIVSDLSTTDSFFVGTAEYTLRLTGFSQDGGFTVSDTFYTYENKKNYATLYGVFDLVDRGDPSGGPAAVPEPSSLAIFGVSAFGMLLTVRRRKNKAAGEPNKTSSMH